MKKKTYLALLLTLTIMTTGCGSRSSSSVMADGKTLTGTENGVVSKEEISESPAITDIDRSKMFSDRDYETGYDENESAMIQLNGDSAACSSDAVQISGSKVTITDEGTYILSGTMDDGMVIVNTDKSDKVRLVLNNVDIHSETCAPIYILQSDKVFITTAADSVNTLSNGGTFTAIDENNIDAAIFSKEDLTLNGSGALSITSPAGHGIVSKDSLKITSGSYDINCASHAISGKDDVCITNADFKIVSGKDGIHAENTDDTSLGYAYIQSGNFHISAEGDGITASSQLQIEGGSFDITAGGGSVNASLHHSDSWGGFQGGMHGNDKRGGTSPDMAGKPDKRNGDLSDMAGKRDKRNGNPPEMPDNQDKRNGNPPEMPDNQDKRNETVPDMAGNPNEGSADITDNSADSTSMKGMKATAGLVINGGEFTIDSADDSFHSNGFVTVNGGTFKIASGDDAFHADETLTVTAGTISITESYEGLEGQHVNISGGDITLTASDDGLNAAGGTDSSGSTGGRDGMFGRGMSSSGGGSITISGGTLKIQASGDGIDANGTLAITGGYTIVSGPTQGDTATLDYDVSGTISGGTFIGTGASGGMAQTFGDSEQGVISVNVGNQSAGTQIRLLAGDGNTVFTYTPALDFELVIFSSPDIIDGEVYTLTAGSSSRECTAGTSDISR